MNRKVIKIALVILFIVIIFNLSFFIANIYLSSETSAWLDGGDWVALIIGTISAGSTIFLGYIAYWQNKKQREDNLRAQKLLEQKDYENKIEMENRYRFDHLISIQHEYLDKLDEINVRLIDNHFMNEILEIANACAYFQKDVRSKNQFNSIIQDTDRRISRLIILINYIQNTVTYNRYYIDEVYDLVISLVRFRITLEILSNRYFGLIGTRKIEDYTIEKIKQLKSGISTIMNLASEALIKWEQYNQAFHFNLEEIECNNDLNSLLELYHENAKKTESLRVKLDEVQEVIKKHYEDNI